MQEVITSSHFVDKKYSLGVDSRYIPCLQFTHAADAAHEEREMTDLDIGTPDKVATVLRMAADKYRQSACDLAAAWQDESAGKVWNEFARILERAAVSCEKAWDKVK